MTEKKNSSYSNKKEFQKQKSSVLNDVKRLEANPAQEQVSIPQLCFHVTSHNCQNEPRKNKTNGQVSSKSMQSKRHAFEVSLYFR